MSCSSFYLPPPIGIMRSSIGQPGGAGRVAHCGGRFGNEQTDRGSSSGGSSKSTLWPTLVFLVPKLFMKNLNFKHQRVKNQKKQSHFYLFNFWNWLNMTVFICSHFFSCWYLKLRLVLNSFWTKFGNFDYSGALSSLVNVCVCELRQRRQCYAANSSSSSSVQH